MSRNNRHYQKDDYDDRRYEEDSEAEDKDRHDHSDRRDRPHDLRHKRHGKTERRTSEIDDEDGGGDGINWSKFTARISIIIYSMFLLLVLCPLFVWVGARLYISSNLPESVLNFHNYTGKQDFTRMDKIARWILGSAVSFAVVALVGLLAVFKRGYIKAYLVRRQEFVILLILSYSALLAYEIWIIYSLNSRFMAMVPINSSLDSGSELYGYYTNFLQMYKLNSDMAWFVDHFHRRFECCGFQGLTLDFDTTLGHVPQSCCKPDNQSKCEGTIQEIASAIRDKSADSWYYTKSCSAPLKEMSESDYSFISVIGIFGTGGIVFFGTMAASTLMLLFALYLFYIGMDTPSKPKSEHSRLSHWWIRCCLIIFFILFLAAVGLELLAIGGQLKKSISDLLSAEGKLTNNMLERDLVVAPKIANMLLVFGVSFLLIAIITSFAIVNRIFSWHNCSVLSALQYCEDFKGQWPLVLTIVCFTACLIALIVQTRIVHKRLLDIPHMQSNETLMQNTSMNSYYVEALDLMKVDKHVAWFVNSLQSRFECCGLYRMDDFVDMKVRQENGMDVLVQSCYRAGANETIINQPAKNTMEDAKNKDYAFTSPCREKFNQVISERFYVLPFVAGVVVFVLLVMILIAVSLICNADPLPVLDRHDSNSIVSGSSDTTIQIESDSDE